MGTAAMTRLLIADDHPFIIAGLEAILGDSTFQIVAKAADGEAVLDAVAETNPDILVLDVAMPKRSGIDVLRSLRSRGDKRPVVLLTASLDDNVLLEALELGVNGIVLKEGAQNLLVECLTAVRQGKRWIQPGLLERARQAEEGGGDLLAALAPRERGIVALVAQGLRNREIGAELGMTEGTVKVYLHRIYEKLGVGNRTELAMLVKGNSAH
jgi:two-component system, NarL family, nitrate/nitrite response regulator NarL